MCSSDLMDVLESHIDYLKKSQRTSSFIVDRDIAYIYTGDFYGYLNYRKVQQKFHWIYMRVNGYLSTFDFKPDVDSLILPSSQDLEQIRLSYINSGLLKL